MNKRRDERYYKKIRIRIQAPDENGNFFEEETYVENFSKNGCCILTSKLIRENAHIIISSIDERFESEAKVKKIWQKEIDGKLKMGVEFLDNSENWLMNYLDKEE